MTCYVGDEFGREVFEEFATRDAAVHFAFEHSKDLESVISVWSSVKSADRVANKASRDVIAFAMRGSLYQAEQCPACDGAGKYFGQSFGLDCSACYGVGATCGMPWDAC